MEITALAVAGVAALAIVLLAVGVATSGGSGISDRLERYAAKPTDQSKAAATGQGGVAELIAQSQALNSLNKVVEQRDFGANLARDIARGVGVELLVIAGVEADGIHRLKLPSSRIAPALVSDAMHARAGRQ